MNKKKKIRVAVGALVAAMAVVLGIYFATKPMGTEGSKTFTVEVTHSDGSVKSFIYSTDTEYVGAVLLDKGLIAGEDRAYGLYVLEVDGEKAIYEEDGAYWAFYVNGEYAVQGVDQTPACDGDIYEFIYTAD